MALPACGGGLRSPVQVRYTSYICTNLTRAACLPVPRAGCGRSGRGGTNLQLRRGLLKLKYGTPGYNKELTARGECDDVPAALVGKICRDSHSICSVEKGDWSTLGSGSPIC